jgi:hypothetical protein
VAFEKDTVEGGIEIVVRVTEEELRILKYAGNYGYETNIGHAHSTGRTYGNPEELIRKLLYWEIRTLELHSGEVEKFRWKLMLEGKEPNIDLRVTNPELFVKSGGIVRDRKIPQFKPRFPALLTVR